jgi:hypothetical protein
MPMNALIATPHLVLILSLLLTLAALAGAPKGLCLAARVLLLLASVENSPALVDWIIGAVVAWLPIRQRIAQRRAMVAQPPAARRQ